MTDHPPYFCPIPLDPTSSGQWTREQGMDLGTNEYQNQVGLHVKEPFFPFFFF